MNVDLKNVPCEICEGTGKTYLEHPDGSLSEQPCPYCQGRKDSTWLAERYRARQDHKQQMKVAICVYFGLLLLTNGIHAWGLQAPSPYMFLVHVGAWLVGFAGLAWWYINPKKGNKARRPHPLTTDREKLMGGALLGGVLLKHEWDVHERNVEADLDRHIAQYGMPPERYSQQSQPTFVDYRNSPQHQAQQDRFAANRQAEVARRAAWNANAQQQANRRRFTSP
jgi:hypothetical protein